MISLVRTQATVRGPWDTSRHGPAPNQVVGKPVCVQRASEDAFTPAAGSILRASACGGQSPETCGETARTPEPGLKMTMPGLSVGDSLPLLDGSTKRFIPLALIFVFVFVL